MQHYADRLTHLPPGAGNWFQFLPDFWQKK